VQAKIAASLGGLSPRGPVKPRESTMPLQSENWPGLRLLLEDSLSERSDAKLRQARRAPCTARHAQPRAAGFALGGTTARLRGVRQLLGDKRLSVSGSKKQLIALLVEDARAADASYYLATARSADKSAAPVLED
jgi:hypothetical protein